MVKVMLEGISDRLGISYKYFFLFSIPEPLLVISEVILHPIDIYLSDFFICAYAFFFSVKCKKWLRVCFVISY